MLDDDEVELVQIVMQVVEHQHDDAEVDEIENDVMLHIIDEVDEEV